jgi:hypothetical protein
MNSQHIAQLLLEQLDSDRESFWWNRENSSEATLSLEEILRKTKEYYSNAGFSKLMDRFTCLFLREAIESIAEDGIGDSATIIEEDIPNPTVLDWIGLAMERADYVNTVARCSNWREDKEFDIWICLRRGYVCERNSIYQLVADYLQSLEDSGFSVADYLPPSDESDLV